MDSRDTGQTWGGQWRGRWSRLAQGSLTKTAGTPGSAPREGWLPLTGGQGAGAGVGYQVCFRPRWPLVLGSRGCRNQVCSHTSWEARDGGIEAGRGPGGSEPRWGRTKGQENSHGAGRTSGGVGPDTTPPRLRREGRPCARAGSCAYRASAGCVRVWESTCSVSVPLGAPPYVHMST